MKLSSKERTFLKKQAHHIDPVVRIGKDGMTDTVIQSIKDAIGAKELIKVKVLQNSTLELTHDFCSTIAHETQSNVVDLIGKTIILFRPDTKKGKITQELLSIGKGKGKK